MNRMQLLWNVPALILLIVLMLVLAYRAGGEARTSAPSRPAIVATVNLPQVLEGLAQRGQAESELQKMAADVVAEREVRENRINEMLTQLEEMRKTQRQEGREDLEAIQSLEEEIVLERLNYQAWSRFKMDQLDVERSLRLEDLHRAIKKAAREIAQASGYDFVIHDDSQGELTVNPEGRTTREAQIQQQITSRSMLYANPTFDITQDLIERMNNQFRMGEADQ